MAALEVEVEKVTTVEAVLALSVNELRHQFDLYDMPTKGLINKPQLRKALIKVKTPATPVLKTKGPSIKYVTLEGGPRRCDSL